MREAGCTLVGLLGTAALYEGFRGGDRFRPVTNLRFLIRREDWREAKAGLESAGWRTWGTAEDLARLNPQYEDHLAFHLEGKLTAYVQWRILPGGVAASERVFLEGLQFPEGRLFGMLNAECAMLDALVGRIVEDPDVVPWEVDAALVMAMSQRGGVQRLSWETVARIANEFECKVVFTRIMALRELLGGAVIPEFVRHVPKPKPHPAKLWYWRMHQKMRAGLRKAK
jgi:hypothetical protein